MKNVLITGGTDGIGKAIAIKNLREGNHVFAVGSNKEKGQAMAEEIKGLDGKFTFFQTDLSLVSENKRLIEMLNSHVDMLDAVVLCAASLKPQETYVETTEGYEFTFALYYLSRFVLSYGLKDILKKSDSPIIINVCAPGLDYGKIDWEDIQRKNKYDGQQAQFEGSRLNDLLGIQFAKDIGNIRYILFNPMAARTNGATKMMGVGFSKLMMNTFYKIKGKEPSEIAEIIYTVVNKTSTPGIYAYKLEEIIDLSMPTFDKKNAERLHRYTVNLLNN